MTQLNSIDLINRILHKLKNLLDKTIDHLFIFSDCTLSAHIFILGSVPLVFFQFTFLPYISVTDLQQTVVNCCKRKVIYNRNG